jgi:hypothetical protein
MRSKRLVILAILAITALCINCAYASNREKSKNRQTTPQYQIDPQVLEDHQKRFGVEVRGKRTVLDNRNIPRTVNVPILSKPSLMSTDPGKKIDQKGFRQDISENPTLPNFPANSPYQPSTLELTLLCGKLVPDPPATKYQWGKPTFKWGKQEEGTRTELTPMKGPTK